jgi:polyribonucleotide nucleotidyltransferase
MPDAIGALIGARGANIKAITESTGARVSVDDTGEVLIYATDQNSAQRASIMVQRSAGVLKVGRCYRGTVTGVKDFGALREDQRRERRARARRRARQGARAPRVGHRARGEEMVVAVIGADDRGRLRLSRRQALGVDDAQIEF